MDFFPIQDPDPQGIHAGVFLRVNDRSWKNNLNQLKPDQTRFGSILWGGLLAGDPTCQATFCGGLELMGDDASVAGNSVGKQKLINFTLTEFPWNFPNHSYRIQIMEEERKNSMTGVWEHWWRAEVVDLTDLQTIGASNWISEWTILNTYGIREPGLPGSKLAIGFGPASSLPFEGSIDADLTGTAYWIY